MKRRRPVRSRWAERRSTVVYAVRSTTFGSWRMLTLGAEYEDTWASAPVCKPRPQPRPLLEEEAEEEEEEEKKEEGLSWQPAPPSSLCGGVESIVQRHEDAHSSEWTHR
ncbi:unnamed protein product [Knipowitschia caucasica]